MLEGMGLTGESGRGSEVWKNLEAADTSTEQYWQLLGVCVS